jgi:hypothetical protein
VTSGTLPPPQSWTDEVCTIVAGHIALTLSGRPLRPSQTRKNTSATPRLHSSVSRRCPRRCWLSGSAGPAQRRGFVNGSRCFGRSMRRKDPADRLSYQPGDQAQCDLWFPPARIPVGGNQNCSPPVLVVVASFSRCITARMVPSRTTPDLLAGIWSLLAEQLRAVPRRLVWDNEAGIGRGGRLADGVAGFTGPLATKIVQLKPFDPESKGIDERANGYLETSCLPGRQFVSPADFNHKLRQWLPIANRRMVRSLGARLIDRREATGRRCCRCRRSRRYWDITAGSGWVGTTTYGSPATTTPLTRR